MKHSSVIFLLITFFYACKNETPVTESKVIDFCASIHQDSFIGLSHSIDSLKHFTDNKTGVYVLEDGDGSMVARAWLCEHAEKSIDIQYFIFTTDNVGLIACDYLVRAADRGVQVRIIVDDIMVEADEEKLLTLDAHPNISIKIYNPSTNVGKTLTGKVYKLLTDFRGANQRMHNKTFTIDGKVVITGGRNIADEYFDYDHEYNFRDRDVLLLGKTTQVVQQSFNTYWESSYCENIVDLVDTAKYKINTQQSFEKLHQYACDSINFWPQVRQKIKQVPIAFQEILHSGKLQWVDSVNFVADIPGKNDGSQGLAGGGVTTRHLINLIMKAKKSIYIQSPYLITTEESRSLFTEAVKRGIEIKILTNSLGSTDNLEAFSGYKRDRNDLLKTGVHVFEFRPDAAVRFKVMTGALQKQMNHTPIFGLHAKSMVIDDSITVVGTFNLDPRSANLNTECITVIYSSAVSKGVKVHMEEELKPENAWETTLTFNPDDKAGLKKNLKLKPMKVIPKGIL